jgi:segregation and condensation protein B
MSDEHGEPRARPSDAAARTGGESPQPALAARVEAILVTSDRPLAEGRIAELLGIEGSGEARTVADAIEELNHSYETTGRSFRACRVAGGWQIMTEPQFAPLLERLHLHRQEFRLSQAALETLAIVAYRQPIMRAEIEAIRGVASGEMLRALLDRRLVRVVGRAEQLGRPLLYGTTPQFLKVFGLVSLEDLPPVEGAQHRGGAAGQAQDESPPERPETVCGTEEPADRGGAEEPQERERPAELRASVSLEPKPGPPR